MQDLIIPADFFWKQGAIFIGRRNNHAVLRKMLPIGGTAHSDADAVGRNRRVSEIEPAFNFGHAAILYAKGFEDSLSEQRWGLCYLETDPIFARREPEMRKSG